MRKLRFRATVLDYRRVVSVLACEEDANGDIYRFAEPVNMTLVVRDSVDVVERGTFDFVYEEAQSLLDALVDAGLRPTKKENQSGEIARLNDHLQDMRKLVFERNINKDEHAQDN